ncbi:MAG TPA: PAS domain S-box protein, partial [Kiritimatiellia bacterium]
MSDASKAPSQDSSPAARATFFSGMRQFLYVAGSNGNVQYASAAYETIWGRSLASLYENPKSWFDAIHPEDAPRMLEVLRTMSSDEYTLEYRIVRPDGEIRWVLDRGSWTDEADVAQRRAIGFVDDITDRKAEEDELRSRTKRLQRMHEIEQRALLDLIPAMVWIKDPDNRVIRANRRAAASLGLEPAEVEGRSTWEFFPKQDADKYHRDDLDVINSGESKLGIVEQYEVPGGERRWVQTDKVPYADDDKHVMGVIVFAQDITNQKREREWLQSLARGLRGIIEMADELIMCPDMDLFYRRAVELAREKLGVERCAIFHFRERVAWGTYGTNLAGETTDERTNSFVIVDEWEEHFSTIRADRPRWVLKDHAHRWNWDGEESTVFGSGWVSYTAIAQPGRRAMALFIHDAALTNAPFDRLRQELVAVYCSLLVQIIEQKRSEEVLRASESKFRSVCEVTRASIFVFQGTQLIYVNPAAEQITGYTSAELYGMPFWGIIHPDYRELVRRRGLARQKGRPVPQRYEVKILTKAGETRWIDYSASMAEIGGQPAVLGVAFDITERMRTESELRTRIASEELTMRISTAVSNASAADLRACFRRALEEIRRFLDLDAASVIFFSDDMATIVEYHGARRRGMPSVQKLLTNRPLGSAPVLMARLFKGDVFGISSLDELPAEAAFEKTVGRHAKIQSFLAVPVPIRGRVCGCLGVGCRREGRAWKPEEASLLRLVGEMLGAARQRVHLEEEHARLANTLLKLQEDERKNMSSMLHDDLGQKLTLTRMELDQVATKDRASARALERASERIGEVLETVRHVAATLRPPVLDDLGVAAGM